MDTTSFAREFNFQGKDRGLLLLVRDLLGGGTNSGTCRIYVCMSLTYIPIIHRFRSNIVYNVNFENSFKSYKV